MNDERRKGEDRRKMSRRGVVERRRTPRLGQERRKLAPLQSQSTQVLRDARGTPPRFLETDLSGIERRLAERFAVESGLKSMLQDMQSQDIDICICGQLPDHHGDLHEGTADHEFTSAIEEALGRLVTEILV